MDPQYMVLILLAVTVVLLVTEWVPMAIVGILLPVALVALGIIGAEEAFAVLADPLTLLVTAAFVFGAAFFRVGLADIVGNFVRRMAERYGRGSEIFVLGLVMVVTALMSSVLPNLGVVAALLPVFLAIAKSTGIAAGRLLMPAAFASSLGGMLTLIGSPNNLIGRGALESANAGTFGFLEFAWMGVPMCVVGIGFILTIGHRWLPASPENSPIREKAAVLIGSGAHSVQNETETIEPSSTATKTGAGEETQTMVVPRWQQILTLSMFAVFVFAIILERTTGMSAHLVGFVCLAILIITRVLPEQEAYKSISWSTLFFIVGILTLANAIISTGASDLLANSMVRLLGNTPNPLILSAGFFLISAILTQFMSNTATAGILAPIATSMALGINGDPRALVMVVVLGASCAFVTAIGTPANMMVAGPGNIRFVDWMKVGWPLLVIGFIVSVGVLPLVWPFY